MLMTRLGVFLSSRLGAFMLLLLWMGVIFGFSTLPGKETAGPPPLWYFIERKGAHVVEYAILMLLSFNFFRRSFTRESLSRVLLVSASFALMYGATDELHQYFVPGRGAKLTDVLIDGGGILLATSVLALFMRNKNRS
jgi:VanZ family protein